MYASHGMHFYKSSTFPTLSSYFHVLTLMSPSPPENVEEKKAVTADPQHVVKHSRFGIWDYWEDKDPDSGRIVVRGIFANTRETLASFPYLIRATNAILEIPGCKSQVALYSTANFLAAFVPAISVWYVAPSF